MADNVVQGFLHDHNEAVLHRPWHLVPHIIYKFHRTERKFLRQRLHSLLQIDRLVPQVMHTLPDACHRLIQRILQMAQGLSRRYCRAGCFHSSHHQDCPRQHMTHTVMDLPGDSVALPEGGGIDLIILLIHQMLVLLPEFYIALCTVIPIALKLPSELLTAACLILEHCTDHAPEQKKNKNFRSCFQTRTKPRRHTKQCQQVIPVFQHTIYDQGEEQEQLCTDNTHSGIYHRHDHMPDRRDPQKAQRPVDQRSQKRRHKCRAFRNKKYGSQTIYK